MNKTLEAAATAQANEILAMVPGIQLPEDMVREMLELAFAKGAIYGSDRVLETWQRGLILNSPAAGSA